MSDSAGGGTQEPKIEELKSKLESLQQGKKVLEEEIMERKSLSECLQKELATLQTEAFQLERTHQERKELSQKLQLQCEESEREFVRLAEQNKKSDELLAQHRYEIQELKLKRRKLRLKFEDQLHQLIKQHNQLYAIIKDSQPKT
ncbi:leucine-rich repeat and coiled-coil domain-containing protein 1 isoform X3 [Hippocampus comes]|uniref:leucine-rich repeat and coiled-coil domain-containing protein 1 isoform X3 n=1 Tax=Hippocampus comes TaxID=109280 RepID=UPI00094F375D|nr:PREDICTED: leucine-rich repeat and coiled-coil domain-containing protein 1-like isoform X3 [Hippocampus comes]